MRIVLSNHAKIRISERNISFDVIKKVVSKPSQLIEQPHGTTKAQKEIESRVYTVVYKRNGDTYIIVTAI